VLDGLEDNITLDFYAAKDALAQDPQSRLYASRVRDMLEAYVARAHGRITLIDHNPAPFSPAEDAAIAAGITAIAGASPDDPVLYLGLTVRSSTGQVAQLPLLSPQREASLEYDISRALAQVTQVRRPRLAVLTSLPWLFARDPNQGAITPIAHVAHELARTFDIQLLDDDFAEIPPQTDVLLIAQPDTLSEAGDGVSRPCFLCGQGRRWRWGIDGQSGAWPFGASVGLFGAERCGARPRQCLAGPDPNQRAGHGGAPAFVLHHSKSRSQR
jgi:ABC-type uncharacterized transport system involved in gliding motility auxiliary subunit